MTNRECEMGFIAHKLAKQFEKLVVCPCGRAEARMVMPDVRQMKCRCGALLPHKSSRVTWMRDKTAFGPEPKE